MDLDVHLGSSPSFLHCSRRDWCRYAHVIDHLLKAVQDLSLARSMAEIMQIVRVAARQLTQADGASFVLRDEDQCFYADEDAISPLWKGQRFPMDICLGGWAMRHREVVAIADITIDERVPLEAYRTTFVKSLAMVPIRTVEPIGAIGVYWATHHAPTPTEISVLQALADTTSVAIESVNIYLELEQRVQERTQALNALNLQLLQEMKERERIEAEVRQLSLTDDLTGLYNRRGFFVLAEQQLKLARRLGSPSYLLFIDLDGLKRINDTQGHEAGDLAIANTATILKATFRESDVIARLGGDEFVVLIANYSDDSQQLQDRLQSSIDHFNQVKPHQPLGMSWGMIMCDPAEHLSLDQFIARADTRMYQVKQDRRSRSQLV